MQLVAWSAVRMLAAISPCKDVDARSSCCKCCAYCFAVLAVLTLVALPVIYKIEKKNEKNIQIIQHEAELAGN